MSELPVDTNQEEEQMNEHLTEEEQEHIDELMAAVELDGAFEGQELAEEEEQMAEFDNEDEVWNDTSRCIPKGATPIDPYTNEKDDNAGEFWFPPSRNCSCCEGYKYGCACTTNGAYQCLNIYCETSSAEEDLAVVERDVVENDGLRHTPVIVYRSSKASAAGGASTSVPAPPPEQASSSASAPALYNGFVSRLQGMGKTLSANTKTQVEAVFKSCEDKEKEVKNIIGWFDSYAGDVVRTGPVTPENIGDIAAGTWLYQGKMKKLLIVVRYNPDSGFIFVQDGEKPPLKMKLAKAGLFWDNG